jgi:hypothetical protein
MPRSHLVIIEAPVRVRDHLPCIFERLHFLSDPLLPPFVMEDLKDGKVDGPFDTTLYSRTQKMALAEATREVGWTGGAIFGLGGQHVLENYWWQRELKFKRFTSELRERIVFELNDGLKRAGKVSGLRAQIQLSGFPTLAELDAAIGHLQAGDRPLTEIHALMKRLD